MKKIAFIFIIGSCLAGFISGCAKEAWYKTGVKEEEKDADLDSCERFAHNQVKKEEATNPPSPNGNANTTGSQSEASTSLSLNLEHYQNRNRYEDLVEQCMAGNGYTKK